MNRIRTKVLLVTVVLLVVAASLVVWSVGDRLRANNRVYRIGWENDPPDEFPDKDGQPAGLTVDLISQSARRCGIRLQWVRHDESSEAALRSGQVDLWPSMTITPERKKFLHISPPFLETILCLLVRSQSRFQQAADLAHATVGVIGLPINYRQLHVFLPDARLVATGSTKELMTAICQQRVDAGFLDQDTAVTGLLAGAACTDQPLRVIPVPNGRVRLGIGSTFEAAAVANRIRNEIDYLAAEQGVANIYAKWGYLSARSVEAVETILSARRRQRWTMVAAGVFAALFVVAWWQAVRAVRQRNRIMRTERALRESEERYRSFFEEDLAGYFISTPDGKLVDCNPAFVRIFGFASREQALQTNLVSIHRSPDERKAFIDLIRSQGRLEEHEHELRRMDGTPVSVIANVIGSRNPQGELEQIRGYVIDDTERRKVEEQLRRSQKMDAIGRLAGGVAHDFNNLLTVIIGYSSRLLSKLQRFDPVYEEANEIKAAAQRAAKLTNQLLAFGRKQILQPRALNLNEVISNMREMLQRLTGEGIDLVVVPHSRLDMVKADAMQIEQVIMNLVINSRDAMPRGGKITLETANALWSKQDVGRPVSVKPGPYVVLAVSDNGCGMDAETQSRIFEPFFTTKANAGTGLGLSTVYGIVNQSGGYVSVYSEVGRGTTFKIYLPSIEGTTSVITEKKQPDDEPVTGSETILVVDDDETVREMVGRVLMECGYTVLSAGDPLEAIRIHQKHLGSIDLLLTDVVMPHMNGRDLAAELALQRPHMKVLYMSGYTKDAMIPQGTVAQRAVLLWKPFEPLALLREVRRVLTSSESRASILIVDDHLAIRKLIRSVLEEAGYRVLEASNAEEALARLSETAIDLMITDLNLPGQGGGELVEAVKSRHSDVKVIMVSGSFVSGQEPLAKYVGVSAVLPKTVEPETLLETIGNVLAVKSAANQNS